MPLQTLHTVVLSRELHVMYASVRAYESRVRFEEQNRVKDRLSVLHRICVLSFLFRCSAKTPNRFRDLISRIIIRSWSFQYYLSAAYRVTDRVDQYTHIYFLDCIEQKFRLYNDTSYNERINTSLISRYHSK